MKTFKTLAVVALMSIATSANAGFVTGLVVGSLLTSSSSSSAQKPNTLFASDKEGRNTIVCCTSSRVNFNICENVRGNFGDRSYIDMTPAQFAGFSGYNILYKTGFVKTGTGCDMIVMEVGKK